MSLATPTLGLLLLFPATAAGQARPSTVSGDIADTRPYVVQPGENLHVIAARLLGDRLQWPHLWRLNPQVKDPNRLLPGQVLRVPGTDDGGPLPESQAQALFSRVSQRVEEQPHPQAWWTLASVGGKLKERDGVRTYAAASAELTFDDGGRYVVGERTLLFLRAPSRRAGARRARSLEVVRGQADVEVKPATRGAREIEIIVAGSQSRARPDQGENGLARARRADSGAAQLMVYGGAGEVEARGVKVDVPRGMGTSVPPGSAPQPPERLLAAPVALGPAPAASFEYANPIFSWEPVPGAASYTLEVWRDPGCGQLVLRVTNLAVTRWASDELPLGALYWRVLAVSVSGLDGFSSAPLEFAVRSRWRRPSEAPAAGARGASSSSQRPGMTQNRPSSEGGPSSPAASRALTRQR